MSLYDTDFVLWTRQQADLLRSMPDSTDIDIEHLTDEIEGLGRSAVAELSNAIIRVLRGLVRRSIDPGSITIEEILSAQSDVVIRSDAGVWRHVDLDMVWRLAKRHVDLPEACPWSIEELTAEDFKVEEAAAASRL
ncbi:DUF29 family protein [Allorhizobium borbori]|uniref:DUF29 domain-containing protein n=1 Tax=Allorhizobium borbori TaxID=485907 RepID=A0A7W6P1H6_9HYPH|nr:DUF29 family protein [Allorhizobium borbori]MBB4104389.1 hypothetical protein [Allorhizobium borbori]